MKHNIHHEKFFSELLSHKPDLEGDALFGIEADGLETPERKNEATLPESERIRFINAVRTMMREGTYQRIATIHSEMQHTMHGSMGRRGLSRFLSWHRRYLIAFEQELQRTDAQITGKETSSLSIPYWRWSVNQEFPVWLEELLPAFGHDGPNSPSVPREPGVNGTLPTQADVDALLSDYALRSGLGNQYREYEKFTYCLEGWADNLPAHNHVHSWVGGVMNNTSFSPADPIFWLNHCEIDRLWWIWQQSHKNDHPPFDRNRLQLDPWMESNYDTVLDISALGYGYESILP
jgi:tyrosinase